MIIRASAKNKVNSKVVTETKIHHKFSDLLGASGNLLSLDADEIYKDRTAKGVKGDAAYNTVASIKTYIRFPNPLLLNVNKNGSLISFIRIPLLGDFNYETGYERRDRIGNVIQLPWQYIFDGSIYLDLDTATFKNTKELSIAYNKAHHLLGGDLVYYLLNLPDKKYRLNILKDTLLNYGAHIKEEKDPYRDIIITADLIREAAEVYDKEDLFNAYGVVIKEGAEIAKRKHPGSVIDYELIAEEVINKHTLKYKDLVIESDNINYVINKIASVSSNIVKAIEFYYSPMKFLDTVQKEVFVLPKGFRPSLEEKDDNILNIYQDLVIYTNRLKVDLMTDNTPIHTIAIDYRNIYNTVTYIFKEEKPYIKSESRYKTLKERISSKEGHIRDSMIGCRVDYSARAVITTDKDMPSGCIGIPKKIALGILEYVMLNNMPKEQRVSFMQTKTIDELYEYIFQNLQGCKVLFGRQPTLYYLGIQPKTIRIIEGCSVVVSPLDVTPYNADFDGDQMHLEGIIDFKKDNGTWTSQMVLPFTGNILYRYPKDGKPTIEFRHEILYGLYTGCNDYCEDYDLRTNSDNSVDSMIDNICNNKLSPSHNDATKYIISQLLEVDIKEIGPKSVAKSISEWALKVYDNHGEEKYRDVINKLVKLGFGISKLFPPDISIKTVSDIKAIQPDYTSLIDTTRESLYKNQYSIYNKMFDHSTMRGAVKELNNCDDKVIASINDDWKNIIKSKARGHDFNIKQALLNKGNIGNCSDNIKCSTVLSSYSSGLSMYENFISANGGRADLIAKNISTADPGYLGRLMAFAAADIAISGHSCGTEKTFDITREKILDTCTFISFERYGQGDSVTCGSNKVDCTKKEFVFGENGEILHKTQLNEIVGTYLYDNQVFYEKDFISMLGRPKQYCDITDKKSEAVDKETKYIKSILLGRNILRNKAIELVTKENIDYIINEYFDYKAIKMFSPLYCKDKCCRTCYGEDLRKVELKKGTRIGLVAAQSAAEPSTQLVMKLFQSGGVEREGGLDSKFEDVEHILNGNKVKSLPVDAKYTSPIDDAYKYAEYAILRLLNIYYAEDKKVNIKHFEVIISSQVRYLDFNKSLVSTYKNPTDSTVPVFLPVTDAPQLSNNLFYRIALENFSKSLSYSMLGDDFEEDSIIEKEAFGEL